MRGRKPKSRNEKVIAGTLRPERDSQGLDAPKGIPDPPIRLTGKTKDAWNYLAPILLELGVLTQVDGMGLLVLCRAAADYLASLKKVASGNDVKTKKGQDYWNMRSSALAKSEARLLKLLGEFGLTPGARSRLRLQPKEEEDDELGRMIDGKARSG